MDVLAKKKNNEPINTFYLTNTFEPNVSPFLDLY